MALECGCMDRRGTLADRQPRICRRNRKRDLEGGCCERQGNQAARQGRRGLHRVGCDAGRVVDSDYDERTDQAASRRRLHAFDGRDPDSQANTVGAIERRDQPRWAIDGRADRRGRPADARARRSREPGRAAAGNASGRQRDDRDAAVHAGFAPALGAPFRRGHAWRAPGVRRRFGQDGDSDSPRDGEPRARASARNRRSLPTRATMGRSSARS